ncbi:uncharacterized protein [Atheta coriaria]|uniref:uncharacterized protein isoform X4 n=1 Tax=Dalotia coriaria TaxID=877792 RepID=UPI0031F4298D
MFLHPKMYMVTFVLSVLSIFIAAICYMLVAYNYDWLSRHCCCCKKRRDECGRCGQEINTVSRHAELRGQMNELPPDYSKVGGLPPAYDLVVAGNPPAYSEAIQLEINASLAHSHRSTTPATDGAHSTDLTGVVVVPPAVASQQQ